MFNVFFMNEAGWSMSGLRVATIIAVFFIVQPHLSYVQSQPMAGTYTIGPNGDYASFSEAVEDMKARFHYDTDLLFEVESGIYEERLVFPSFLLPPQTSNKVTFRSESGNPEDVVLRAGGGSSTSYVIDMHGTLRNVTFENFTVESTGNPTQLIYIMGQNHALRNMIFRGGGIEGAAHTRGLTIENSTFYGSRLQFVASTGMGNFRIMNNKFYGGRITINSASVAPLIIANNTMYVTQDAIYIRDNRTPLYIYNNYIRVRSARHAMWLHEVGSVFVYHNTLKTIGHGTAFWSTNWGNVDLKNNILYSTLGRVMDIRNPDMSEITADFNGYYTGGNNTARIDGIEYATWEDYHEVFAQDTNSVYGDPRFGAHDGEEYEPMVPESFLYASGGTDLSGLAPEDLLGNPRPVNPSLGALEFIGTDTSVPSAGPDGLPGTFGLAGNYPNPFNPVTTIRYSLPEAADITITVYDIHGRHLSTLLSTRQAAGTHSAVFDASGLASGMYIYRITANSQMRSGKMLLLK